MPIVSRPKPTTSKGRISLSRILVIVAALGVAACQPQIQQPSDLLFAPTFSKSRQNYPETYGTKYDCRTFQGSGWKGISSGTIYDFDRRDFISQAGCFASKPECEAWLVFMSGWIDVARYSRCNPHNA